MLQTLQLSVISAVHKLWSYRDLLVWGIIFSAIIFTHWCLDLVFNRTPFFFLSFPLQCLKLKYLLGIRDTLIMHMAALGVVQPLHSYAAPSELLRCWDFDWLISGSGGTVFTFFHDASLLALYVLVCSMCLCTLSVFCAVCFHLCTFCTLLLFAKQSPLRSITNKFCVSVWYSLTSRVPFLSLPLLSVSVLYQRMPVGRQQMPLCNLLLQVQRKFLALNK